MLELLKRDELGIVEQAIWAIGNLSFNCRDRNLILKKGGVNLLVSLLDKFPIQKLKSFPWALRNICVCDPKPKFSQISKAI